MVPFCSAVLMRQVAVTFFVLTFLSPIDYGELLEASKLADAARVSSTIKESEARTAPLGLIPVLGGAAGALSPSAGFSAPLSVLSLSIH